jgi:PII-like signaling protein
MSKTMKLLRIYTDEASYYGDRKLYQELADRVRNAGLGGATVLQALFGFGRRPHTHRRHVLEDEQSLVIELVDTDEALRAFVTSLSGIPGMGLITMETVEVLGGENVEGHQPDSMS